MDVEHRRVWPEGLGRGTVPSVIVLLGALSLFGSYGWSLVRSKVQDLSSEDILPSECIDCLARIPIAGRRRA